MAVTAKFEGGMCPAGCGNRIHEGDLIRHDEEHGAFVHDSCSPARSKYDLGPGETVCGVCWLVRPCRCEVD